MTRRFLFILPATVLVVFLTVYGTTAETSKPKESDYQAVLRLIGHRLLLSTGDAKSRVMPVKALANETFQIRFENHLSLEPDSIVSIITKTTKLATLPTAYNVSVLDCLSHEVVYSFVMAESARGNILPCLSRTLPTACYYINIDFSVSPGLRSKGIYLFGGVLSILLLSAYLIHFYTKKKRKAIIPETKETSIGKSRISIGEYLFHVDQRYLEISGERIELTEKESKLLLIFASTPNEIIDRERIQKEVWEKEGVIVTRSLDVFISKLRKKLEKDPGIKISNVHGKGYKLELFTL